MTTNAITALTKIQLGRETTPFTAVPATTINRGIAILVENTSDHIRPPENIGVSTQTTRQFTAMKGAAIKFPASVATFNNVQHIFEAGIKTVTPTQDGVGTGYVNTYPISSGDSQAIKQYTIEAGNNKTVKEVEGCFVVDFELKGEKNKEWTISHNWEGRQAIVSAFTAGLSIPVAKDMLFNKSKLYIDNVSGTMGNTQIANSWLDCTIKVTTGWKAMFTGDGSLYLSHIDWIGAKATIDLTLLHNATTAAEEVLFDANTPRLMQISILGDALTTPATETVERCTLGFAGVYSKFEAPSDADGSQVYKVSFECGYDPTAATFGNIVLVNQLSAVP